MYEANVSLKFVIEFILYIHHHLNPDFNETATWNLFMKKIIILIRKQKRFYNSARAHKEIIKQVFEETEKLDTFPLKCAHCDM